MPYVEHQDCHIHYRVSGSGPLLLLLHGFFGSHAAWKRNGIEDACHDPMEAFAADYGLNYLTVPGDHSAAMRDTASYLAPVLKTFL